MSLVRSRKSDETRDANKTPVARPRGFEPGSPVREGSAVAARPGGALVLPAVRRAGAGAVRAVRGDGRGEQLALRPGGEPGVGAQGGVERPGEAPAMETPEGRVTLERGTFI